MRLFCSVNENIIIQLIIKRIKYREQFELSAIIKQRTILIRRCESYCLQRVKIYSRQERKMPRDKSRKLNS